MSDLYEYLRTLTSRETSFNGPRLLSEYAVFVEVPELFIERGIFGEGSQISTDQKLECNISFF